MGKTQHITKETKDYLLSFWYRCDQFVQSLLFGTDVRYSINRQSCCSTAVQLNKSTQKNVSQIKVKLFVLHWFEQTIKMNTHSKVNCSQSFPQRFLLSVFVVVKCLLVEILDIFHDLRRKRERKRTHCEKMNE